MIFTGLGAPIHMITRDLNNDGRIDVIASSKPHNKISWFEHLDGTGTFGSEQIAASYTPEPDKVEFADVDGDNQKDLISISQTDRKIIWFKHMNGTGDFSIYNIINSEINYDEIGFSIGDIDNDGDIDVVSASSNDGRLSWYENINGQGDFAPRINVSWNLRDVRSIHLTDLNNDGNLDIIYGKYDANPSTINDQIGWFKNLGGGTGSFQSEEVLLIGGKTNFVTSGDVNGNNQPDVIATLSDEDTLIWLDTATLSSNSEEQIEFSVYLVPSSDIINIQTNSIISKIDIYNVHGQMLLSSKERASVDISSLTNGIYMMRVWDNLGNYSLEKIIKN